MNHESCVVKPAFKLSIAIDLMPFDAISDGTAGVSTGWANTPAGPLKVASRSLLSSVQTRYSISTASSGAVKIAGFHFIFTGA